MRLRRFFLTFLLARVVHGPTNPYDVAGDRAREGDWRAKRFLVASEQLSEIEAALVRSFEAEDDQWLLGLAIDIECMYDYTRRSEPV